MQKCIVINNTTIICIYDGKNIVVDADTVFVIDRSFLNTIFSQEYSGLVIDAEYIFAYLDYLNPEKENRRAILLEKWHTDVLKKLEGKQESKSYFEGHCQSSEKFLGKQTSSNEEETIALVEHLTKLYTSVLLITDNLGTEIEKKLPSRSKVISISEAKDILNSIPAFESYVNKLFQID